jgi:hypothetical protein
LEREQLGEPACIHPIKTAENAVVATADQPPDGNST